MRRICSLILVFFALFPVFSYADDLDAGVLNRVSMRLNAEQWVTSKSALVTIGINAGVSDAALATIQEDVIKKLNQLSSEGEWHIVSFDRSLDPAGLEKIQMSAQARLPATALPKLRDKTKAMSKPGETYTLDNVMFTPSEDEMRAAESNLRGNIYLQAKAELDRINKQYPDQKFYIHDINFMQMMMPQPMANVMMAKVADAGAHGNMEVGNKLNLNATVVFAAIPDAVLAKSVH